MFGGRREMAAIGRSLLGELCADVGSGGKTTYAVDCSGASSTDTLRLTQVLWPDHCVINRSDSLFHSQLNVLPTDLVVRKGYNCHASILPSTHSVSVSC